VNIDTAMPSELPDDLPWKQTVGLLLDALQVKDLLQRIYEWSPAPQLSVLYQGTQWAELGRLSPCLVRVHDRDDPVLSQFLKHAQEAWGYLLVSDRPWDELVTHMRWLTSFQPPDGDEMFLRISDPAVAHALFAADHGPGLDLFGPCEQILIASSTLQEWTHFKRPGDSIVMHYGKPFMANDAQWSALKGVAAGKAMVRLYQHMRRFFPEYRAELSAGQRLEHIHQLARSAVEKGFESEQEIWLYANVFGLLGDDVLERHPDIARLLNVRSAMSPLQRANSAATLAAQRRAAEHAG
jgi:hypothetical protein